MLLVNQRANATSREDVYRAIAQPTRRRILDLLAQGERPVKSLVEAFTVTQPAISQHLRVLKDAGLVVERSEGTERRYRLEPGALAEVDAWLEKLRPFWKDRLRTLGEHLDRNSE